MNPAPGEFILRISTGGPVRDVMTTPSYQFVRTAALRRLGPTGKDKFGQPDISQVSFGDRVIFEARRTNIRDDPLDKIEYIQEPDGTVTTRERPASKRKQIWDVEVTKEILP